MNNLKRVLSLALASVMLIGMMVVGASAATNFTDADEIEHDEAVDVLVSLGVINGKEDGSYFAPADNVTRGEMAKMIAVAMMGGHDVNTGTKGIPSFTDIGGHWAESYIEYCYDLGIIAGRGDGTFDPNANVTGTEVTKMVLSALGYDADAYKLKGASWAVRTDELARTADPSLYDELSGVVLNTPATRDTAAQIIWNGLQNQTRKVTPSTNTNTGEVTWKYDEGKLMLWERYNGQIIKGTYKGNEKSGATTEKGEIVVGYNYSVPTYDGSGNVTGYTPRSTTAHFPSDMGIENIGEEVMVVWKDGKDGTDGKPDKHDTIYGVFNTGKTEVFKTTFGDLQDAKEDVNDGKIKFGDTLYETTDAVKVYYNYVNTNGAGTTMTADDINKGTGMRIQAVDEIKFVCNNDGKINAAYVTNYGMGRVTGVSAAKISVSNIGTINIADNDVYEDAKVDDVVVYTRFYNASDKDKAFFTVTKAAEVEGNLTGFKFDSGKYKNVVVDGTTYKVNYPAATLPSITVDDPVTTLTDSVNSTSGNAAIGDKIRLYMTGKMVGCVQSIEASGGKYALVKEVSSGTHDAVDSTMNPLKVTVLLPDGTEQTLNVHKDSTKNDNGDKIKDEASPAAQQALFAGVAAKSGDLIEYTSIANGSIKIKKIVAQEATAVTKNATIWDEDSKIFRWGNTATDKAVAGTDAVIFVGVDNLAVATAGHEKSSGKVDKWYAYKLRDLSDIKSYIFDKTNEGDAGATGIKVSYIKDSKGLVQAAMLVRNNKAGSSTADTLYGIVTGYTGTRQNADDEDMWVYTVAVGRDEDIKVAVLKSSGALKTGELVMFDERTDGEYELGEDITIIVGGTDGKTYTTDDAVAATGTAKAMAANTSFCLAAIREYNESKHLLTFYANTQRPSVNQAFTGTSTSYTTTNDVKIVYVNHKDDEQGEAVGVTAFDATTGFANAVLHINDKGVVDAIIMETSGEVNLAAVNSDIDDPTATFGSTATDTINTPAAITASSPAGAYSATVSSSPAEIGSTVTVTVKCTTAPTSGTDTITLTGSATIGGSTVNITPSGTVTFGTGDLNKEKTITFTMIAGSISNLTIAAVNAA